MVVDRSGRGGYQAQSGTLVEPDFARDLNSRRRLRDAGFHQCEHAKGYGCHALSPCHAAPFVLEVLCASAWHHRAYLGDGSGLSGVVDVIAFDGSGPLDSEEAGPPGVVAGTFP